MQSGHVKFGVALVVLTAVALATFQPLTRHPHDLLVGPQRGGSNDLTSYFLACHNYPRICLDRFRQWPWWNPFSMSGVPYVGNPQSALFYPPNWIFWWIDARDAISWMFVGHHLFAGVGTYLLCRRYGFAWLSSVLGGTVMLAAPYLVAHTGEGHYAQICEIAWVPWAFLAFEEVRSARRGGVTKLAVYLAMSFFAGHVQEAFYLVVILTALAVVDIIARWRCGERAASGQLAVRWALVGVTTVALVAVDLVPMLVCAGQGVRSGGLGQSEASAISAGIANFFQLLNPFALGGPASYGGRDKFFWESLCSFGTPPLILAIVGAVGGRHRYPSRRFAGLVVFGCMFALGEHGPIFPLLHAALPGLAQFRVPSRVFFFCSMAVAVLAACGADTLVKSAPREPTRAWLIARCCFLAAIVLVLILLSVPSVRSWTDDTSRIPLGFARSLGSRTTWAWLLASIVLVISSKRWPRFARHFVIVLFALTAAQLVGYASKLVTALPVSAVRTLHPAIPSFANADEFGRVLATQEMFGDLAAWEHGIHRVQGYDPLALGRYAEYFQAITGKADTVSEVNGFSSLDLQTCPAQLLDLAGVRYAVLAAVPAARLDWEPIEQGQLASPFTAGPGEKPPISFGVFRNPHSLPHAFVVGRTRALAPGEDRVEALASLQPRDEVLMSAEFLPPGPRAEFAPAMITELTANRVTIDTDLAAPGYLVLTDTWYPGWTATDNGRPTSVIPANIAFRAVPLAGGKHTIIFQFSPPGFLLAAAISGVAWLGMLASLLILRRRRDQNRS